ncbi:MAG: FCD domain-containing protein [Gemmatimonadetes bacterium]|nr:FCD domain-containing protein [Gemmatimonadota bacterium]
MEGLAAWGAAGRDDRDELVADLNRTNAELLAEAEGSTPSREWIFQLDNRFHRSYVEGGAGPRLLALHDAIKPQAERYTRLYVDALLDQIAVSVQEHQVIVDAIAAGDPDLAQNSVRTNWRNAAARLSGVIARAGELGSW